jgi:hypothetical protein
VGDYYGGRFAIHARYVTTSVLTGQPVDWTAYGVELSAFMRAWSANMTMYPTTPTGDSLTQAKGACHAAGAHQPRSSRRLAMRRDAPPCIHRSGTPGVQRC